MAAARVTSIGSSSSAPHASANSLASARLTARNVFSYSFVASAASVELTTYTSLVIRLMILAPLVAHSAVMPPTTRGVSSG